MVKVAYKEYLFISPKELTKSDYFILREKLVHDYHINIDNMNYWKTFKKEFIWAIIILSIFMLLFLIRLIDMYWLKIPSYIYNIIGLPSILAFFPGLFTIVPTLKSIRKIYTERKKYFMVVKKDLVSSCNFEQYKALRSSHLRSFTTNF